LIDVNPIRTALVEDSAAIRERLEALIDDTPSLIKVGSAASVPDAIQLMHQVQPELLLLDIFIEGGTGMDVLHYIRANRYSMPVAVMTSAPSEDLKQHCLALGALWFVDKAEIADAISDIGREVMQHKLARNGAQIQPDAH
jgi:response regulator of citrate/malate metabolism